MIKEKFPIKGTNNWQPEGLYIVRYSIRLFSRTLREAREIGKQELHKLERSEKTHTLER